MSFIIALRRHKCFLSRCCWQDAITCQHLRELLEIICVKQKYLIGHSYGWSGWKQPPLGLGKVKYNTLLLSLYQVYLFNSIKANN